MRLRVFVPFALALLTGAGSGVGCGMADAADLANSGSSAGSSGVAGQVSNGDAPSSLEFENQAGLALPARAQARLSLRVLPAKVYSVRFSLPSSAGDPLDAVLDRSEVATKDDGIAEVLLTAPSATTSFDVRASVDGVSTSLPVSVKDTGFATVQVQPRYPSALRDITTWIATAHVDVTCADLPGIPPADGTLLAPPAAKADAPLISQVPAGTRLAITLRSGHFVGGCTSVEMLPAGPADLHQSVQVAVLNRPIDLSASTLSVALGLTTPETTWSTLLTSAGSEVLVALDGTSTDNVDALLDAMRDASGSALQTFENTRKAENWGELLRTHWGPTAASKLRDSVGAWLSAGRQQFAASPHLLEGTIDPVHQANPLNQRGALLTLSSAAGLDAEKAGFVSPAQVSWSASSDDSVVIGTELYLIESQLAAALAEASALALDSSKGSAAEALADTLDCAGISSTLTAAGPNPALAYGACDATCLETLCHTALGAIWRRGKSATALSPTLLSVTASGVAHVGDSAEVAGMGGTWIGQLKTASGTSPSSGVLTAAQPPLH